jgi:hypothetical protein
MGTEKMIDFSGEGLPFELSKARIRECVYGFVFCKFARDCVCMYVDLGFLYVRVRVTTCTWM